MAHHFNMLCLIVEPFKQMMMEKLLITWLDGPIRVFQKMTRFLWHLHWRREYCCASCLNSGEGSTSVRDSLPALEFLTPPFSSKCSANLPSHTSAIPSETDDVPPPSTEHPSSSPQRHRSCSLQTRVAAICLVVVPDPRIQALGHGRTQSPPRRGRGPRSAAESLPATFLGPEWRSAPSGRARVRRQAPRLARTAYPGNATMSDSDSSSPRKKSRIPSFLFCGWFGVMCQALYDDWFIGAKNLTGFLGYGWR